MADGFGISFYGFFVFAALWCAAYFVWAVAANRKQAAAQQRRGAGEEGDRGGHEEGRGGGSGPASPSRGPGDDTGARS